MMIRDCMSTAALTVDPDDSLQRAAQRMSGNDIGFLPVTDGERLIGIVTDRDIAVRGIGAGLGPDSRVRRVMSPEVRYCYDDEEAVEVLANMSDIQVRRLPVVDAKKRLVGIVAITDLARAEASRAGGALKGIARRSGLHSQSVDEVRVT